ncbi:MAG: glycosyltransferase family 2 protein [Planctomycetes bacterium]|nr:glycosyltransferase family 2 protein [Planctomycetota bacterium]
MPDLSLVIPAFNEEMRLPAFLDASIAYLTKSGRSFEIIVVDDGSRDGTQAVVQQRASLVKEVRLLALDRNSGKGAAVRAGMLAATGDLRLFADADGATTMDELARLEAALAAGADVAIGSREGKGTIVRASAIRRFLGRWFNRAVRLGALRGIRDTQCGFKLFKGGVAAKLFGMARESGFAFDVEILYLARKLGHKVAEVPVNWTEIPGSKVRLLRDGFRMLVQVQRIRRRWRSGEYSAESEEPRAE